MFSSSIITANFINGLLLLFFLQGLHGQPPLLSLTSISEGCLVNGQSMVLLEGIANFTDRDSIADWSNRVRFSHSGGSICSVQLDACSSSQCYCEQEGDEYRVVLNRTADHGLEGTNIWISSVTTGLPIDTERSNRIVYPQIADPVQETVQFANSSSFDISSGILPDGITSIKYRVLGLEEPYNIMYNASESLTSQSVTNTTDITANFNTSQRILVFGYEELGTTCKRQITHTLCRQGGIEETVKFDDVLAMDNTLPLNVANVDYTLLGIIEPYVVEITISYDALPQANHTFPNNNNIMLAINGSREICIRYQETGTGRLSQCLAQTQRCFVLVSTTAAPTGSSCPCDCDDWEEPHTVVLFIAMLIKVICGVLVLILYCKRETVTAWPVITLFLCFIMVGTAVCDISFMCYQEIDDCGLCDCQYAFILIEMIITLAAIFFIVFLLYKEGGAYFQKEWFLSLLLVAALAMAVISIAGIIVVFCNKEIAGSGVDSWHVIYLLIGITMAAAFQIGLIALFACQGSQVKNSYSSRNGKSTKIPNNEHEMNHKNDVHGKSNLAYDRSMSNSGNDATDNNSKSRNTNSQSGDTNANQS